MVTRDRQARLAGLWFLAVIVLAPVRLVLIADDTARDLLDHESWFRAGIVADLACGAAMLVAKGNGALADAFSEPQRMALAEVFLRLHDRIVLASEFYWGLWLLPLARVVWQSGFLPRFLSVWLVLNGFAYVVQCVVGFMWPPLAPTLRTWCAPLQFGEIAFALWLLCAGARPGLRPLIPRI